VRRRGKQPGTRTEPGVGECVADDGDGASRVDSNIYGDRGERYGKQGSDLGAIGKRLQRGGVWHIVSGLQSIGGTAHLYGSGGRTESGQRHPDGNVGGRWNEDGDSNDYSSSDSSGNFGEVVADDGQRGRR
jgi:hypothetical protein